eukprot:CAMPEP_0178390408 /NCGR_PEP_ID=MMETSP0689_2-20121128/10632_1 /TAXON_ID=160604 /ORGANISM="Amphidinium massartii, Strain CS-259" /LENGTH=38 /DNA_ID= /DNA_START= /DNA_END= /DNA_ORIENTATION=
MGTVLVPLSRVHVAIGRMEYSMPMGTTLEERSFVALSI